MRYEGLSHLVLWTLAGSYLWIAGCGSVGEPRPPLVNIPEQPADFEARQAEDQLLLSWAWPLRTTGGELLRREIVAFEVFSLDVAQSAPPSEIMDQQGAVLLRLDADTLGLNPGDAVQAKTGISEHYGKKTAIAVRAQTSRGKSPWSNMTVLEVARPPAAPQQIVAEAVRDGVRLAWQAVESASAYLVERRLSGNSAFQPAGRVEESQFLDRAVVWEQEHEYRIRAEVASATGNVPGPASVSVSVTANDSFAPEHPQGLRAVVAENSVELTWAASDAFDLAGYVVIRDGKPSHEDLLQAPAFSDRSTTGPSHQYAVIAVDRTGNRSEPSETVTVSLR